jgi:hypothetical protein
MTPRLSTSSDGRGPALTEVLADWAAHNPKIRRVWACETPVAQAVAIALELQPVTDSEETEVVWLANCERWRRELQPRPAEVRTLVYERAG